MLRQVAGALGRRAPGRHIQRREGFREWPMAAENDSPRTVLEHAAENLAGLGRVSFSLQRAAGPRPATGAVQQRQQLARKRLSRKRARGKGRQPRCPAGRTSSRCSPAGAPGRRIGRDPPPPSSRFTRWSAPAPGISNSINLGTAVGRADGAIRRVSGTKRRRRRLMLQGGRERSLPL